MTTSAILRSALAEKGITNGRKLAEHLKSPGVIYFIRGDIGWWNSRAELRYRDEDGHEQRKVFRPEGAVDKSQQVRTQLLEAAQAEARERLGVESWSRAPFSNCWLPSEDVSKVHAEFDPE